MSMSFGSSPSRASRTAPPATSARNPAARRSVTIRSREGESVSMADDSGHSIRQKARIQNVRLRIRTFGGKTIGRQAGLRKRILNGLHVDQRELMLGGID